MPSVRGAPVKRHFDAAPVANHPLCLIVCISRRSIPNPGRAENAHRRAHCFRFEGPIMMVSGSYFAWLQDRMDCRRDRNGDLIEADGAFSPINSRKVGSS